MNKLLWIFSIVVLGFTGSAMAEHNIQVKKLVKMNASADQVWAKAGDYGDLGVWHPAIAKTEIVEGANNEVGAKRVLTTQDGGKIDETLTAYSVKNRSMSYVITESVLPVDAYRATLTVKPAGKGKSVVTWVAHFKAKAGADDKTAKDTINGIFDSGLANLKKIMEAK